MNKVNWNNLSEFGPKTLKEAIKWELDKQAALAIRNLRHTKSINQHDIEQQIATLPSGQQDYFCQRLNHHELPEHKA